MNGRLQLSAAQLALLIEGIDWRRTVAPEPARRPELYAKTLHVEKLKAQLAVLRRARFGQSSEKIDRQIDLLELVIGELEEGEAQHALEKIGVLFAIEREINGQSAEARLAVRQARTVPLIEDLRAFFDATLNRISRKGNLAKAINYSLNRWEALTRFSQDGHLEMTNNAAERAIRPLTLGRRNWTFLGSDTGGHRAAAIFTITQTCRLNSVNAEAYLTNIIQRVASHPNKRIDELMPWNWTPR